MFFKFIHGPARSNEAGSVLQAQLLNEYEDALTNLKQEVEHLKDEVRYLRQSALMGICKKPSEIDWEKYEERFKLERDGVLFPNAYFLEEIKNYIMERTSCFVDETAYNEKMIKFFYFYSPHLNTEFTRVNDAGAFQGADREKYCKISFSYYYPLVSFTLLDCCNNDFKIWVSSLIKTKIKMFQRQEVQGEENQEDTEVKN